MAAPSALCGSPAYMAPEVVHADGAHLRTRRFAPYDGRAADAWSAGVTLFEAAHGGPPFRPPAKALDPLAEMAALHAAWVRHAPLCRVCELRGFLSATRRPGGRVRAHVRGAACKVPPMCTRPRQGKLASIAAVCGSECASVNMLGCHLQWLNMECACLFLSMHEGRVQAVSWDVRGCT